MTDETPTAPDCFGDLDVVFPISDDGLRASPAACLACDRKTACLAAALKRAAGLAMQEERVDQAYASGMIGFFQRWSRKKDLQRRRRRAPVKKKAPA